MFSNLRSGNPIYILHKESTPYLEVGQVVSVSIPQSKFHTNTFLNPQDLVVDVVARVKENNITLQKLPANLDIADQGTANGALVIATSKDIMSNEITSLKQKSSTIVDSIDYHKKNIQDCEKLLQELNPEVAKQKQQKQEIDNLKSQISEMVDNMKELMNQMREQRLNRV
jgi:uncharacterized coiled-coil protein SlyX